MDQPDDKPRAPSREIGNADLFADDIVFSDTEKILFEEDLKERAPDGPEGLMEGNPEQRYTPVRKLNEGGMKAIWEVDDHRTARKVAMALIQDSKIASEQDIDAFLYEARLTANLQHPNIIPIYDIALDENGNPYFTMKALRGETLGEILKKLRAGDAAYASKYTRTRLLNIFLEVSNAINYAHSKGVIHLDLKPSNIIVGDYGDVHVLDWGLSTLVTHLGESNSEPVSWHSVDEVSLENGQTLTHYLKHVSGSREKRSVVGGTPGYMAPEQAQGAPADIDFQTDVYALGAILYELLTRHCPIEGGTVKEALQKTVRGEIPDPGKRAPELRIPAALAAIAMKALQSDPADRYPSVSALIADLQKYQDGFATSAENPTFFRHVVLLVKRHKMAVGLIAGSAAVIAAVLFHSFAKIRKSEAVAVGALADLQVKNDYIAAVAKKVAPTYLDLVVREEKEYAFNAAEQALDTGLAFDPSLKTGWMWKGKMLLCQQDFSGAWKILSGNHGHPVQKDSATLALAEKYKDQPPVPDTGIPELVRDFESHNMAGGIPRLFYHLNRQPFNPQTRFVAIAQALQILNPKVENLHFAYQAASGGGWLVDASGNPNLDDISPLCGLDIRTLDLSGTGSPDLKLITEGNMVELRLSGTTLNHLPGLPQLAELRTLDLGRTHIRNLANIIKYPHLASLDISGIDGLAIPRQLVWNRNLRTLTIDEKFKDDPTVRALARRGVIMIYTDDHPHIP